jgi:Tol biopolymer transport system component
VSELRILDRATGDDELLLRVEGVVTSITWAPGDERLLYGVGYGALPGAWSVGLDGEAAQPLTVGPMFGAELAVSPDGRLATSTNSHVTDLHLQPLDGGASRRLTAHSGDNFEAQVSPDGRTVAYTSSRRGAGDVWLLDLETGEERALTSHPDHDSSPGWSPDGRQLVFVSFRDELPGIWVVDFDGRPPRRLTDTAQHGWTFWTAPRWSPDGQRIGFIVGGAAGSSLVSVSPDGEDREVLLEDVQEFDWYLDSSRIVYLTGGQGDGRPAQMHARDLETGREVVLFQGPHVEMQVARDGSAVSFCRSRSHYDMNLQVLRLLEPDEPGGLPSAAGEPEVVAHGRGEWHVHNGGFTPDGKAVVYTRDTDTADIYELEGVFTAAR